MPSFSYIVEERLKRFKGKNYTLFFRKILKEEIINCQNCSKLRARFVYHIDKNKQNNELGNLRLLCLSCLNFQTDKYFRLPLKCGKEFNRSIGLCDLCGTQTYIYPIQSIKHPNKKLCINCRSLHDKYDWDYIFKMQ